MARGGARTVPGMAAAVSALREASPPVGLSAPPQDLEAEQGVLGAILLSDATLTPLVADEGLEPAHFYRSAHGRIFEAMLELHAAGEPVDALTLRDQLRRGGALEQVGGAATLELLAGAVPAVGNVRRYAAIVRDCALRRAILDATYDLQQQVHAGEGAAGELLEAFQAQRVCARDGPRTRPRDAARRGARARARPARGGQPPRRPADRPGDRLHGV